MKTLQLLGMGALMTASAFAADPALLALVDPNAKMVAGMSVEHSASSPLGRFLLGQMQGKDADFQKFVDATGFDPRRDIREIIVASDTMSNGNGLIAARGIFDVTRLAAALKTQGATTSTYNGATLLHGPGAADTTRWIAFTDSTTAVIGEQSQVKAAIDRRNTASALDPKISGKVQEVSSKYDAWMVSILPMSQFAGQMPDKNLNGMMQGDVMQGIEMTSAGVSFGSTVQMFAEAVTRSDKDAQALMDVAKFITSMVQMNRQRPEVGPVATLMENLNVTSTSNRVSMSLSIPEENLEKMIKDGQATHTVKPARKVNKIVYRQQ